MQSAQFVNYQAGISHYKAAQGAFALKYKEGINALNQAQQQVQSPSIITVGIPQVSKPQTTFLDTARNIAVDTIMNLKAAEGLGAQSAIYNKQDVAGIDRTSLMVRFNEVESKLNLLLGFRNKLVNGFMEVLKMPL